MVACGGTPAGPPRHAPVSSVAGEAASDALQPGDLFDVFVYGEDALPKRFRVADDGSFAFPFVGRLKAAGLTPVDLAEDLAERLKAQKVLQRPQVVVFVAETAARTISVAGAVKSPGTLELRAGMTVVEAISQAGGFLPLAARDSTVVTREVDGQPKRFSVQAGKASGGEARDFVLHQGDIVFVPERVF